MEITDLTAQEGSLHAHLLFCADEPLRTSEVPGLPAAVLRALPGLRGHRCDNTAGMTFPDELADTEIAHLVEHATLELMAMAGSPASVRGATSWDFAADGRGVFRVQIAFDDEIVAREALALALALVRALVRGEVAPDAEAEARRIRARGRAR